MFKLLFICLTLFINFALADFTISKFDVIEVKKNHRMEKAEEPSKKPTKRYALVMSSTGYNASSKTILVAPAIVKNKDYKGKFVMEAKHEGVTYLIFLDKIRTISKSQTEKILFKLNKNESKQAREKFSELTKDA
jgi:mRNA-degrading endonuclease toxin of MazEF toxin-antitoxin module